jgi:exonuclease SbcD
MNLVELNGKDIHVEEIPIVPLRDVKKIRGSFDELMSHEDEDHYIYAELTDLRPIDNVSGKLKGKYPYLLGSLYVSLEKKESDRGPIDVKTIGKGPLDEDFAKFYETMTGKALSSFQKKEIQEIAQAVQGEKQ